MPSPNGTILQRRSGHLHPYIYFVISQDSTILNKISTISKRSHYHARSSKPMPPFQPVLLCEIDLINMASNIRKMAYIYHGSLCISNDFTDLLFNVCSHYMSLTTESSLLRKERSVISMKRKRAFS